jgi:hypothetical protein
MAVPLPNFKLTVNGVSFVVESIDWQPVEPSAYAWEAGWYTVERTNEDDEHGSEFFVGGYDEDGNFGTVQVLSVNGWRDIPATVEILEEVAA